MEGGSVGRRERWGGTVRRGERWLRGGGVGKETQTVFGILLVSSSSRDSGAHGHLMHTHLKSAHTLHTPPLGLCLPIPFPSHAVSSPSLSLSCSEKISALRLEFQFRILVHIILKYRHSSFYPK